MKKILFVTDALKLNTKMLDFAAFLCNLSHASLTGISLENQEHEQFQEICTRRGIDYTVHRDHGNPLQSIITESRFADLILLDVETSFTRERETIPTSFVKGVLAEAECPVIILPVGFAGIEQLVFSLDGQPSSIYAMKQFTYLFPQLREQRVVVISINEETTIPDKLKEWLHMHYKSVEFVSSPGNVRIGLLELVLQRSKAFVVMGAYGRSTLSNFLRPSHANPILRASSQPVFIAHQ
jgi:nucleotide-binding universal stress UspA family protein